MDKCAGLHRIFQRIRLCRVLLRFYQKPALIAGRSEHAENLVKLYGTAMLEIDNEQLRKIINTQMSECACDQYDAFKYMNDRGMYKTEPAPVQKIKAARTKFGKNVVKSEAGASKIK